eukprot:Skav207907  [mRNA]  locus=scaffold190:123002:126682:- [translate_table: standard]
MAGHPKCFELEIVILPSTTVVKHSELSQVAQAFGASVCAMALSLCSVRRRTGTLLAFDAAHGKATFGSRSLRLSRQRRKACSHSGSEWSIDELINCNEEWRQKMMVSDPEFFDRTAKTQKPRYLWIGGVPRGRSGLSDG